MASSLEQARDELYNFFDKEIVPIIVKSDHNNETCKHIVIKFNGKFSSKYRFIARRYGATIRVSANFATLGIIFFMAATREGHIDATFRDPCYWGKMKKLEEHK